MLIVEQKGWNRKLQTHRYIVDKKGGKRAIVLPVQEYREMIEDLHDLAIAVERRDEPVISFRKIKDKLKTDGLL